MALPPSPVDPRTEAEVLDRTAAWLDCISGTDEQVRMMAEAAKLLRGRAANLRGDTPNDADKAALFAVRYGRHEPPSFPHARPCADL